MLITTTDSIEGHQIDKYLGIVTGETVCSVSFFSDIKAGIEDLVGKRLETYEKELEHAKDNALVEMIKEGEILGAHAVVGVDIDYLEMFGKYIMVVVNGTAVQLKDFKPKEMPTNYMLPAQHTKLED